MVHMEPTSTDLKHILPVLSNRKTDFNSDTVNNTIKDCPAISRCNEYRTESQLAANWLTASFND